MTGHTQSTTHTPRVVCDAGQQEGRCGGHGALWTGWGWPRSAPRPCPRGLGGEEEEQQVLGERQSWGRRGAELEAAGGLGEQSSLRGVSKGRVGEPEVQEPTRCGGSSAGNEGLSMALLARTSLQDGGQRVGAGCKALPEVPSLMTPVMSTGAQHRSKGRPLTGGHEPSFSLFPGDSTRVTFSRLRSQTAGMASLGD